MSTMKAWIGLAVVLAGCLGAYVYLTQTSKAPAYVAPKGLPGQGVVGVAATNDDPFDVLITFADDGRGFSPSEVSIPKGARVRFLNDSSAAVWPASGVHPTHSLYPGKEPSDCLGSSFDACQGLKQGEFFDFTFNYAGEWRYHDHIHAYNTGVITVTE